MRLRRALRHIHMIIAVGTQKYSGERFLGVCTGWDPHAPNTENTGCASTKRVSSLLLVCSSSRLLKTTYRLCLVGT